MAELEPLDDFRDSNEKEKEAALPGHAFSISQHSQQASDGRPLDYLALSIQQPLCSGTSDDANMANFDEQISTHEGNREAAIHNSSRADNIAAALPEWSDEMRSRDLAAQMASFIKLQDEVAKTRVQLQQLRKAASRARKKADKAMSLEPQDSAIEYFQQLAPKRRGGTVSISSSVEAQAQEAEQRYTNAEFHFVPREAQLVVETEKLREAVIRHGKLDLDIDVLPALPTTSEYTKPISHHSTEFSFFSETGHEQSSVIDPDAPDTPHEEQRDAEDRANDHNLLDYFAPDLKNRTTWDHDRATPRKFNLERPELYVIDLEEYQESGTNNEEDLEPTMKILLKELSHRNNFMDQLLKRYFL